MKLLLYADLQATDGAAACYHDPTVKLQHWRTTRFFDALRDIYEAKGCSGLIDLGDTTDDRSAIPVPTINAVLDGLRPFNGGFNLKLVGNHEQYLRDASVHVGKLFENTFQVIDKWEEIKSPVNNDVYIFISYPGNYTDLQNYLIDVTTRWRGHRMVLFGHFQVFGCMMNSGLSTHGVPRDLLAPFKAGFLGHVHKPQNVNKKIYYVGSPFQQDFGESGEDKRVAIFDCETLTTEWVSLMDHGFPRYLTVTVPEWLEQVAEGSEDRFKVILTSQADAEKLYAHPLCNRVEPVYNYEQAASGVYKDKAESWCFNDILARWVKNNPPKEAGIELDAVEMLEIGTEIAHGET